LKQLLEERECEVACLTEEKRFYQLELMKHESTYNHLFGVQPIIGVLDPLYHHRKKGLKVPRGKQQLQSPETWSWQVTASSVPPISTQTNTSHIRDFQVRKSKSLEPSMVHIKECVHGKVAEICKTVPNNKAHPVMSTVDHMSNLVSTSENSAAETCRSQIIDIAVQSNFNTTPDQMVSSGSRESCKSDKVMSAEVHSDKIMADSSPVTNHESVVRQDCTLIFSAVDVPDSKMSILLQSHKNTERNKIHNFEMRSKSVETAANEVHTIVLSSTSTPSLQ